MRLDWWAELTNDLPSTQDAQREQQELIRHGVELFNNEQYFECHEVLEQAWLAAQGPEKLALQGLIQVAVAFHHLRRENFVGAQRLLRAGVSKLAENGSDHLHIRTGELIAAIEPLLLLLRDGTARSDYRRPAIQYFS
ncbi:MAG: DUF309 domain-containing protein [Acidobacteria bacterium]|nr:DUF309 domain-containing protein [Acidobacteriota bacterium]